MRGTFANVRLRNQLVPGTEGSWTVHFPSGEQMSIYDAAMRYMDEGVPLVVLAGKEYGSGLLARLGGEGPEAARRAGRDRRELRAHPPLEPGRHGRPAAAVRRRRDGRVARPDRRGDLRRRPTSARRRSARRRSPRARRKATEKSFDGDGADRHPAGMALLPQRRDPPVRPAAATAAVAATTDIRVSAPWNPDRARELLTRERERIEQELASLRSDRGDGELSNVDQHTADSGSELFEVERDRSMIDRLENELRRSSAPSGGSRRARTACPWRAASRSPTAGSRRSRGPSARPQEQGRLDAR